MFRTLVACILLLLLPVISQAQSASSSSSSKYQWKRTPQNPVVPAVSGSLLASSSGAPDVLFMGNTYYLYFYGQFEQNARIGVSTIPSAKFDGTTWDLRQGRVLDIGGPGSADEVACIDPSAIEVNGRVYLYYTGVNIRGTRSICLATSNDGIHFTKFEKNPVLAGTTPEAVYYKKTIYLFFRRLVSDKVGFQIYCATSQDSSTFTDTLSSPVLGVGPQGSWDSFSVETPRIYSEGKTFYMTYSGSDRFQDYPFSAGLATSKDLVHWTKYSGNPIFSRGYPGTFDEGAIWFPGVIKHKGKYYMYYQGFGGGPTRDEPHPPSFSGGKSQVGMAWLDASYLYMKPDKKK
jgi:predicted GH43/DUF377 family glycosyl hydrolase